MVSENMHIAPLILSYSLWGSVHNFCDYYIFTNETFKPISDI